MRKKHSKPILNRIQNSTFLALIKNGQHDSNVGAGESVENMRFGIEEPDVLDAILFEEGHHLRRHKEVFSLRLVSTMPF